MMVSSPEIKPFVIGLTGAIGTGKSLVRKMLEHKGALTIDADQLAHQAYIKGTSGFHGLVQLFGNEILDKKGQIDRKWLGELVFRNPQALARLEALIHPLVIQAVQRVIDQSPLPIIVIEAVKLLQSSLREKCDVIWVIESDRADIYQRLAETRGLDRESVDERLGSQQFEQLDPALIHSVLKNQGDADDLWGKVSAMWDDLSGKSKVFEKAFAKTKRIIEPFIKYQIQPNDALQAKAVAEINKRGLFFLPVRNLNSLNLQANDDVFNTARPNKNLYQYYLWQTGDLSEENIFLISDIENFISTAAASAELIEPDEFEKIISLIQDFSRLHLCEKMYFPFNKESKSLSDALGFEKTCDDILPDADFSPLGYNLLCKRLRPPLELFREN